MSKVLSYYTQPTFAEKLFLRLRYFSAPLKAVDRELPNKGTMLDIGCGPGLLCALRAEHVAEKIVGIDPDEKKVALAQKLGRKFPQLRFIQRYFTPTTFKQKFDVVTLIDVEYLLPIPEKEQLLKSIKKVLSKDGVVAVKNNPRSLSLGFLLCYLQEIFSVFFTGMTHSSAHGLYFLSVEEYRRLFKACGYTVIKEAELHTAFYHPHYLFLLKVK